ncbi:hypothetical protein ACOSQ2_003993 [Xanthoceras sorbifolium]
MNFIFEERRTQRVRSSNPEGFDLEPSGFHEPRRVRIFEPLWVRDRTQRVRSSNPSGFEIEPFWVRRSNPPGFDENQTQKGSFFEPFCVRGTQRVRDQTLWVRRTNPLGSWNPEGSKIEPSGFEDTNPYGFVEPIGFEDRAL